MKDISILEAMKHSPVRNYVVPGLTSWLIGGAPTTGGCVRLFESDRDTREWVAPHSHRFDFVCFVLAGEVENIVFNLWDPMDGPCRSGGRYAEVPLVADEGGLGKYSVLRDAASFGDYYESVSLYKAGETYSMTHDQIHSIRFSRGARVLFFEGPEVAESSVILEPFTDGKIVPTFGVRDWMFQRGDS